MKLQNNFVKWQSPAAGMVKVNVDAALSQMPNMELQVWLFGMIKLGSFRQAASGTMIFQMCLLLKLMHVEM